MKNTTLPNWYYRENNCTLEVIHLTEDGCPIYQDLMSGIHKNWRPYSAEEVREKLGSHILLIISNLNPKSHIKIEELDVASFSVVDSLSVIGAFQPFDLSNLEARHARFNLKNTDGTFVSPKTKMFEAYVTSKIYLKDYSARGNVEDVKPGESQSNFRVAEGCEQVSVTGAHQIWLSDSVNKVTAINSHTVNIGVGESTYSIKKFHNDHVRLSNGFVREVIYDKDKDSFFDSGYETIYHEYGPLILNCSESFATDNFPTKIS